MAFEQQEKGFTGAHTGTLNILNQRKPRLNQNMNRRGLHRKLLLCLCETEPYLQLVPRPVTTWLSAMQQLLDATDATKLLFWIMRTSLSSRTQDLHVCCLPALPKGLPVPASASPAHSPCLPHPCLIVVGFLHQRELSCFQEKRNLFSLARQRQLSSLLPVHGILAEWVRSKYPRKLNWV